MWTSVIEIVVGIAILWLLWRFVSRLLPDPRQPAEPGDSAETMARLRPRPKSGAGAIALAEPEEDDDEEDPGTRKFDPRRGGRR